MIEKLFTFPKPFVTKAKAKHITIIPLTEKTFKTWIKKQKAHVKTICTETGFKGQTSRTAIIRNAKGELESVVTGVNTPLHYYDFSKAAKALHNNFDEAFLKTATFQIEPSTLKDDELEYAHISWGLAAYEYLGYKAKEKLYPKLLWDKNVDKKSVTSKIESLCLVKNLINTPANDMSPSAVEKAARKLAKLCEASITVTKDQAKLQKDFPLIHMVGKAAEEPPRLIEINWGKKSHPKVTIIGKGVTFDTGGLNIKPTQAMALMKKDMGGAAHALALGKLIMEAGLKVQLTLLLPVVENSISDESFRPGDVVVARNGKAVENTNTDAEGRLILADTLTYASEKNPDLIVDYATLTGSARAALGPDIPAFFATEKKTGEKLQKLGFDHQDPVWQMPLWDDYNKHIKSSTGDIVNSAGLPGDLIYSALFLKSFLIGKQDWVHLDCYAWEYSGRAGRPRGGADTGLRAVFALIKERYG